MKNISTLVVVGGLVGTLLTAPVYAEGPKPEARESKAENRQERRENILNSLASAPAQLMKWINKRSVISKGTIESITGSTLNGATFTISKDGKTYTVTTDDKTQFHRRFFGKIANLSEIQKGHVVTVVGKWTNDERTSMQAVNFRDISIQKRFGVFFGNVLTINGNVITMQSKNRGTQTVTVGSTTRFVNRKEETIAQTDIKVGQRIRVKGLWDSANNTVTEVTQVKDFDLPVIATPTPKQ